MRLKVFSILATALALIGGAAGTPADEAFIKVWSLKRQDNSQHALIVKACREAIRDRDPLGNPTLGIYLPVVHTIAGWHLLHLEEIDEATKQFEAAYNRHGGSANVAARSADKLARRWLSRIDHQKVRESLKAYYTLHVSYPVSLEVLATLPKPNQPPARDRQGDPWIYQTFAFKRLATGAAQRYTLISKSLGPDTSSLADALEHKPLGGPLTFIRRNQDTPAIIDLSIDGDEPRRITLQTGTRVLGLQLVAVDSVNRFALITDDDFWYTATRSGGN